MCIYICHFLDLDPVGRGFIYLFIFFQMPLNGISLSIVLGVLLCLLLASGSSVADAARADQIVLVILKGVTGPPVLELRREITRQFDDSNAVKPFIHVIPGDLHVKGEWTLLPIFPK